MSVITRQGTSRLRVADLIADASCRSADDLYPAKAPRSAAVRRCRNASGRPGHGAGSCRSWPTRPPDAHGHPSQVDGLCQDPVPNARLQATRRGHVHMTPDDLFNVKRETAEVEQRGVRTGATRRSTSLASTASPRATEPNTRTSRKPRRVAAARICFQAARRDPRSGDRSCCGRPGTKSPSRYHMLLVS